MRIDEVVRVEHVFVERVLAKHGLRGADRDDARQEVFLAVQRKLPSFEGRSSLRTWLYRVCANVASDLRRRRARSETRFVSTDEDAVSHDASPHELLTRRELAALLEEGLGRLDEAKRTVLVLHEVEQMTVPAIATRLGIPTKTAFSRLYAARKQLREHLEARGVDMSKLPLLALALPRRSAPWIKPLALLALPLAALIAPAEHASARLDTKALEVAPLVRAQAPIVDAPEAAPVPPIGRPPRRARRVTSPPAIPDEMVVVHFGGAARHTVERPDPTLETRRHESVLVSDIARAMDETLRAAALNDAR